MEALVVEKQTEREELTNEIPSNWEATRQAYLGLVKAETNARRQYRRGAEARILSVEGPQVIGRQHLELPIQVREERAVRLTDG